MRFLILVITLLCFIGEVGAQIKPAQSQYLKERGALVNPSFEQGYKGWTISGCTKSLVSDVPYLNKSLKLTCVNETFSIKQETTGLSSFQGQQIGYSFQIKTSALGVKYAGLENGNRAQSFDVLDSTTYKKVNPTGIIAGATSNGVEIYSDTNYTGEIILDDVGLELTNLVQEIGQSYFVGKVDLSNNCIYINTTSSYAKLIDTTCEASSIVGGVRLADNPNESGIKVLNPRTDGVYRFEYQGLLYNTNNANTCKFILSDSTANDTNGLVFVGIGSNGSRSLNTITSNIRFTDSSDGQVFIFARNTGGTSCEVYGDSNNNGAWSVHFYPDNKSIVAAQTMELTAKTANRVTTSFDSTGSILKEEYENAITFTSKTTGAYTLDFSSLGLTEVPSFHVTGNSNSNNDFTFHTRSATTSSVIVRSYNNGVAGDGGFDITLIKQGADVNKNNVIYGKFDRINSTDLCQVEASERSPDQSITALVTDIEWDVNITQSGCNAWNGTQFTAPRDGRFNVDGFIQKFGASSYIIYAYVNGSGPIKTCTDNPTSSNLRKINCYLDLNEGDTLSFRADSTITAASGGGIFNYITITEDPDHEAIVKNLSNQVETCQKKALTANVTTTGVISELTFNNLTIGKKYRYTTNFRFMESSTTTNEKYAVIIASNSATGLDNILEDVYTRSLNISRHQDTAKHVGSFVAVTTYFNTYFNNVSGNMVLGASPGGDRYGWAQLCELPDTVILNSNKFD